MVGVDAGCLWRRPLGPHSSITGLMDHPVVHVAYEDAEAYASRAGEQLSTEAEWEYAAARWTRCCDFYLGDEMLPGGKAMANTWQGEVPWQNHLLDGHDRTSPVGSFPPNGYGLRYGGKRLGVDQRLVFGPAIGREDEALLW